MRKVNGIQELALQLEHCDSIFDDIQNFLKQINAGNLRYPDAESAADIAETMRSLSAIMSFSRAKFMHYCRMVDIDDDEMDDVYEKLLLQIRYIDLLVERIDAWADEEYEESKNDMFTN